MRPVEVAVALAAALGLTGLDPDDVEEFDIVQDHCGPVRVSLKLRPRDACRVRLGRD